MKVTNKIKRSIGYVLGFILFYAPFALFGKLLLFLLGDTKTQANIHEICFRKPIEHLLDGKFFQVFTGQHGHLGMVMSISTLILIVVAFLFGPIFCGWLCPAGAIPEYLSKFISDKYKIDWGKHVSIIPIRYGFFLAFILAPFFGVYLACELCNYFVFDLFINFVLVGRIVAFSSSLILTSILWVIVLGIFTKGGRGFCNFLCPVGALSNLSWMIGNKLKIAKILKINKEKCIHCNLCVRSCPMDAISVKNGAQKIELENCILCNDCKDVCPVDAIEYIRDKGKKNEKSV